MDSLSRTVTSINSLSAQDTNDEQFSVHHVHDIRAACVCLLDAIAKIISARHHEGLSSYRTMTQQMISMNETLFRGIRDRYLWWCSTYPIPGQDKKLRSTEKIHRPVVRAKSVNGLTNRYIHTELDKLLQCLTNSFDSCKTTLIQSLKRRTDNEVALFERLQRSEKKVADLTKDLDLSKRKLDECHQEKQTWFSRFDDMEEKLMEAGKQISVLERQSNVITWQEQLDVVTLNHQEEKERLQEKLCTLEKDQTQTVDNMKVKIKKMEEKIGKLKIKTEVTIAPSALDLFEKLEYKKRELYLRDQEIYRLKRELNAQHLLIKGCLNGLETDYVSLLDKWVAQHPRSRFGPNEGWTKFQAMLRCINESWSSGTLDHLHQSLPSHYCLSDANMAKALRHNSTSFVNPLSRDSSTSPKLRAVRNVSDSSKSKVPHPQLISHVTGRVDMLQVMKHFPYLTMEQVLKQWENFMKYDKNKNFCLDLPELYEVVQDVCGTAVTAQQLREVMQEVDRDQSNSIDFYEYLKISEMLMLKQGNSYLFKTTGMDQNHFSTSQMCTVQ